MDQRGAGFRQPVALARLEVDRVAVKPARPKQAMRLVGIKVIARLRIKAQNPFDLVHLLGKMGLHQAVRVLGPERAQCFELFDARGRRKAWRNRIGKPVHAMPARQQGAAVVIGRLCGVAQALGRCVAIHAGLARDYPLPALLRLGKDRIDAFGMDRAIGRDTGGAVGGRQVEVSRRDFTRIIRIAKAHFLGEGIAVQPVDQPFAPARDDRGLRVMGMGIDETGHDDLVAVVFHAGFWRGGAQHVQRAERGDLAATDADGLIETGGVGRVLPKGRAGKGQHLPGENGLCLHDPARSVSGRG